MASVESSGAIYQFGDFRLNPAERLLSRWGQPVPLTPKAFDLLIYLVERQGRLVEKSTLLAALWPDTIVEEANLAFQISALRKALDEGDNTKSFIRTVPTKGYRFVGQVTRVECKNAEPGLIPDTSAAHASLWQLLRTWTVITAVATTTLTISAGAAWLLLRVPHGSESSPMRVIALTTLSGREYQPTFSPDGTQVAFVSDDNHHDEAHIYVTLVGSSVLRRLTTDAAIEYAPSWSPDGQQIAFIRRPKDPLPSSIYLVSPLGGVPSKLTDFLPESKITWSPDSRYVVVAHGITRVGEDCGLYAIRASGGVPQQLTRATAPTCHSSPAFSPDGRSIAFVSCVGGNRNACHIYALDVDHAVTVVGSPRRITTQLAGIRSITWTRDGKSLVSDQTEGETSHLWKVDAFGSGNAERIEAAGDDVADPATATSRDRLAFTRVRRDMDIYSVAAEGAPQPLLTSSYRDFQPQFSPDGRQIAFSSARSPEVLEIWMAASDGTQVRQLTHGPGSYQSEPHWSPDGRTIAFESSGQDGHWHIWTIDADGGAPRQLTGPAGSQTVPSWSHDGRWVYFTEEGAGKRAIWRIPATGGQQHRVTDDGDIAIGYEAADGESVVYRPSYEHRRPLLSVPVNGGPARVVVSCVRTGRGFAVGKDGVYYVACEPSNDPPVRVFNPLTGRDRVVATPENQELGDGDFTISPDGRVVLYTRRMETTADLMLIENFK